VSASRGNGRQDAGLFFLATTGAFSLWSATNTSYTGHMAFGMANPKSARTSMNLGLAFVGVLAGGMLLLYGKKATTAALGAAVAGGLLYAIYDKPLRYIERGELPPGYQPSELPAFRPAAAPVARQLPAVPARRSG